MSEVPAPVAQAKPTIVLIHGLWMTPASWEEWIAFFATKGYTAIAPGWPGIDDRTVADVKAHPEALKGLSIHTIVDNYAKIIEALPTPPIIMGHSFGGLFTQILASRGYGCATVGICPGQPSGVVALPVSTIKSSLAILGNPLTFNKAVPISEKAFHYNFGNHLDAAASKVLWEKYSVPAAAHVLWQAALSLFGGGDGVVEWSKKDRAPLLLIAGTEDHVVPPSVVNEQKKKYHGPAIVDVKIFEGRTHGIVNQDGWEEVASYALNWVEEKIKV